MPNLMNEDRKSGKVAYIIFFILLTIFVISRTAFLDRDLPPGLVSYYVPIDEFYYTIPAFNLYHYGEMNHNVVPDIVDINVPVNIMENAMTHWSLSIFGNDYYGLRMASFFSALAIFILLYFILKKILDRDPEFGVEDSASDQGLNGKYILYFLMAYLLCDFSFLVAGRVAEPTIFRMLALVIVIYLGSLHVLSKPLESKWVSIFLGFLALAAVVFVYIYNAFIFFALAVTVFMWAYQAGRKNAFKQGAFFLLGSLLCLLCYQVFAQVVYHSSLLEVYQSLLPFRDRMGLGISNISKIELLETHLLNAALPFMTNIFRFNVVFLFLFLISLPVFIQKVNTERSNFDILIANLLVFLVMQSVVINDWYLRKLVIILPLSIILIAIAYTYSGQYFQGRKSLARGVMLVKIYWLLAWGFALYCYAVYLMPGKAGPAVNATGDLKYLNLGVFLLVTLLLVLHYSFSVRIKPNAVLICLLLILIPNLSLDSKYVFLNRTYYFRDSMVAMGDKVDGKIVAGGCAYGFRLYNSSIPVLNFYISGGFSSDKNQVELYDQNFDRVFEENLASYSIAFTQVDPQDPLFQGASQAAASGGYMNDHGLQLEEEFKFPNLLYGDVGLYALESGLK